MIIPAPTVLKEASSMRMKLPVVRFVRYSSKSNGTVVRSFTLPISFSSSDPALVSRWSVLMSSRYWISLTSARPLPPAGYGTLSQDNITIGIQSSTLLIKLVPLDEWVIRLTAPDTYRRLNGFKVSRGEEILQRAARAGERGWPRVFLVSFFTRNYEENYEPNDVQIRNQSFIYRPLAIIPITQGWGAQRLDQRETQSALYAFDGVVSLDTVLEVEYAGIRGLGWDRILVRVEAERSRVRARASRGARFPPSA